MTPKLTDEMRQALESTKGRPVNVKDEQTQQEYILMPLSVYQRLSVLLGDDQFDVTDAYAAQSTAAGATGWDDPEMDIYDQWDFEARKSEP
jgi:hypothetical protein